VAFQVTTSTRGFPSSSIPSRGCESANPILVLSRTRSRSIHPSRATPFDSCRPFQIFASCTVASFIGAVFRYAKWTHHAALPDGDSWFPPSSFHPAALLGS
jgi:hypothetical protein